MEEHWSSPRNSSHNWKNSSVKIGGIAFNKITVGRKRIVKFKITNPGPADLPIEGLFVHHLEPSIVLSSSPQRLQTNLVNANSPFSPNNLINQETTFPNTPRNSSSQSSLHKTPLNIKETPQPVFGTPIQSPGIGMVTYNVPSTTFAVESQPTFPLTLKSNQECECAVSFSPKQPGFFSGLLEIVTTAPHPRQRITLHGEAEMPTSPQQIMYHRSPQTPSKTLQFQVLNDNEFSSETIITRVPYESIDQEVPGTDQFSNYTNATKKPTWSSSPIHMPFLSPTTGTRQPTPLEERIAKLENCISQLMEQQQTILQKYSSPTTQSNQRPSDTSFDESMFGSLHNSQGSTSHRSTLKNEEDAEFYAQLGTENHVKSPFPNWRQYISGSTDPYSPSLEKMAHNYKHTGSLNTKTPTTKNAPSTPQLNNLYQAPTFSSPFWKDPLLSSELDYNPRTPYSKGRSSTEDL